MSEGAPVNRDKACFAACLQVINTIHYEVGIQAARWYNAAHVEMLEYSLTFSSISCTANVEMCVYCHSAAGIH